MKREFESTRHRQDEASMVVLFNFAYIISPNRSEAVDPRLGIFITEPAEILTRTVRENKKLGMAQQV